MVPSNVDSPGSAPCPTSLRLALRTGIVVLGLVLWLGHTNAAAQTDLPPDKGGTTYELGMPPVYKGNAGVMAGSYRPSGVGELSGMFHLGLQKDLLSPVIGIAALQVEGYIGVTGRELNGGGRLLFKIPSLHVSLGPDYDVESDEVDLLLRLELATRRGGIFGKATMLRIDYLPGRQNTIMIGIDVPLWGKNLGKTRPRRDAVKLASRPLGRIPIDDVSPALAESLTRVEEDAHWITLLSMPFDDQGGKDPQEAYADQILYLKTFLDSTSPRFPNGQNFNELIRVYHQELDRTFSIATSGRDLPEAASTPEGRAASAAARRILLDDVVFPYNRLLGQRKAPHIMDQYIAIGMSTYAEWVANHSGLPRERWLDTAYAFQRLVDIAEITRLEMKERWEDTRFIWIPLQLGIRQDEHDTQDELDAIIGRAVGQDFQQGNHVWYVMNEDFQLEMARSVMEAEDYHVLWVHDYRGKNGAGNPDAIAFEHTLNYLRAMTMRVRKYDETGKLPIYMIFLDQHYFELNKGRVYLRVLHDPLNYHLDLPKGYEDWEARLEAVQDSLRQSIEESLLLQVEISQYGQDWLEDQVKVHINITNPADFSFTSNHIAGIIPIPDNMMRDHRKIAFYDLTEEDPYKGMAMFTGMGIGEHYAGANWEDRAIMINGPGALPLKHAARSMLEMQGFTPTQMPYPLRPSPKPADYDDMVEAERANMQRTWGVADLGEVLQLHNRTGFAVKQINVAKAVLYSMMPAGCFLKVPDSLWQNYVYASMLAGSALRGCHVLIYAPTLESAPAKAGGSLARAYGLLSALINFSNEMAPQLASQDGVLRIGLYNPEYGVGDLRGRITQARAGYAQWLSDLGPSNPAIRAVLDSLDIILNDIGYEFDYLVVGDSSETPKLHMKANYMIGGDAWRKLMVLPEWGPVMRGYIIHLAALVGPIHERPDPRSDLDTDLSVAIKALIKAVADSYTPEERRQAGPVYLTVGSVNMDYRSMVMDGEAMVITTGWSTFEGLLDFIILPGLCEWIDDIDRLGELFPPPSGFGRWMGNFMKLAM